MIDEQQPITKEDLRRLVVHKLGLALVERAQNSHWTELHRNQCMRASDQIFELLKTLGNMTLSSSEDY